MTRPPLGRAHRGLSFCGAIPALLLALAAAAPRAAAEARLVSSDARGVTVEFRLPGLAVDTVRVAGRAWSRIRFDGGAVPDAPGLPALPADGAGLGIPRAGAARLTVLSVDASERAVLPPLPVARRRLEDAQPFPRQVTEWLADPAAYARAGLWPARVAGLGPVSTVRYQRVQALGVRPVRYDAARGVLWVASRILVRVDFEAAAGGSAPGGSALGAAGAEPAADEGRAEESLYRGALLNYDQARSFRLARPVRAAAPAPRAPSAAGFPDFKLRVDTTGVYAVTFAQLQRKVPGLVPIPVGDVRCFEKLPGPFPRSAGLGDPAQFEQEVPIRVVDVDGNGLFDGDDYLVFFGRGLADRFRARWFDPDRTSLFYTRGEVYWLGQRAAGAPAPARMAERPASLGLAGTYAPASYRSVLHREDRRLYMTDPDYLDQSTFLFTDKITDDTLSFQVADVDSARPIGVRAGFRGSDRESENNSMNIHELSMSIERPQGSGKLSDPVTSRFTFMDHETLEFAVYDSRQDPAFALTGTSLSPVRNVLHIVGEHPDGAGGFAPGSGAYLQWFEIACYRRFLAPGTTGRLAFTSGDTLGALALGVGRLREATAEVYDVTDSAGPVYVDVSGTAVRSGSFWQVSFQDTAPTRPHAYFAASRSYLPQLPDAVVVPDTPSALAAIQGADLLIITHESLESEAQRLAAAHAAQGLSVVVARVGDVYDEFDGGRKSDVAIKRLMRRAFYRWHPAPRYLLLMGESSENPRGHLLVRGSNPPAMLSRLDLMPSPRAFGSVPVGSQYEVTPEDHWYVVGLDTTDRYPMFPAAGVGRISAYTPAEAAAVVDKVIAYQHPTAADTWRSRNLYVSDDTWSNGLSISTDVLVRNDFTEIAFRRISEALARTVSQTAGFSAFGTDSFYLADYTDSVHTCDVAGDSTRRGYFCMAQYGHNYIAPLLWN
ncbi:MAG TPA: C25 family cysteine peptidase [Candidatus Saccharimonadales bacterium]|nr:C25 family cysteine peptidase [Candidatus Saccharimonadales bacterium]